MSKIYEKLSEYKSLLDFNNEDRKKDFKGNYKFIEWSVKRLIKHKESEESIIKFLQDTINIHKECYNKYLNQI